MAQSSKLPAPGTPLDESQILDSWRIRAPVARDAVLSDLIAHKVPLWAYPDRKRPGTCTQLLGLDQDRLYFSSVGLGSAGSANCTVFIAVFDQVPVQFEVGRLQTETYDHRPAFSAALPEEVIRAQRRNAFRIHIPAERHTVCVLARGHAQIPWRLPVLDISIGGASLSCDNAQAQQELQPGYRCPRARVDLGRYGMLETALSIVKVFDEPAPAGDGVLHRVISVYFEQLTSQMESRLQQFVSQLEVEQRRRENDGDSFA